MTHSITRTVNDVVKGALYLGGIIARNQATPGVLLNESIDILNEVIDELNGFGVTIPYYTDYSFSLVAGTRNYRFTPKLLSTATNEVTSNLLAELVSVRLTSGSVEHNVRIDDINSVDIHGVLTGDRGLPQYVSLQKYVMDGAGSGEPYSQVWFYPFPDTSYTCTLRAKAQIDHISNSTVLTQMPPQLHRFLKYALARELVGYYQLAQNWTQPKEEKYQEMKEQLMPAGDYDMTIQNSRLLNNSNYWYSGRLLSGS
tara:strand:- start:2215 stop:2982 length:768 start_codon:yes stop_codon:yes gene_type:complete